MWILVSITSNDSSLGSHAGHRQSQRNFQLNEQGLTFVGRDSSNEVACDSASVEKWRHAVFCKDSDGNGKFRLKDLGSVNGTYINGIRLSAASNSTDDWIQVNHLDSIRFGLEEDEATFRLENIADPQPQTQPCHFVVPDGSAVLLTNFSATEAGSSTSSNSGTGVQAATTANAPVYIYPIHSTSQATAATVTAVPATIALIAQSPQSRPSPVANSSAQTSPTRSLTSSSGQQAAAAVLDAIIKDVHAASSSASMQQPTTSSTGRSWPAAVKTAAGAMPIDSGFGDSLDAMTHQAPQPQPAPSPPVRDEPVPAPPIPSQPVLPPSAFAIEFGDSANLSTGDSISKFLPEHLRRKQQQQEVEKQRSREAAAREIAEQEREKEKLKKASSAKSKPSKPSSLKSSSSKIQTSSKPPEAKQPPKYSEQSFYREAIEFDRNLAQDDQDDKTDQASESGTYTIAIEDESADSPPSKDANSGEYAWHSVLDKFFASSGHAQIANPDAAGETPSVSSATSSTPSTEAERVNQSIEQAKTDTAPSTPKSTPTNMKRSQALAARFQMPPPAAATSRQPTISASNRRPQSAGYNNSSTNSSTATTVGAKPSPRSSGKPGDSMVLTPNDSLSTEILLQDTARVVQSLQQRQQQKASNSNQKPVQSSPKHPAPFARNTPERRSLQTRSQPRTPGESRTSSNSRNTLTSVGSGLDGSANDVYSSPSGRDRLFVRLSGSTAASQRSTTPRTRPASSISSEQSSRLASGRQSGQSLGTKIVLKSRDNAKMDQFRGHAAVPSRSRQPHQAPKPTPQDEQRQKELEAWRRRKGYDPRKSVDQERQRKASSRASSLSRQSVDSQDEVAQPTRLLNHKTTPAAPHAHAPSPPPVQHQPTKVKVEDDDSGPRELSLEEFGEYDDDEFILVYDQDQDEEQEGKGHMPQMPVPNGSTTPHSNSRTRGRTSALSQAKTATTSRFSSAENTPRSQYQQLKDGRRVLVLTDETWAKFPTSPPESQSPQAPAQRRQLPSISPATPRPSTMTTSAVIDSPSVPTSTGSQAVTSSLIVPPAGLHVDPTSPTAQAPASSIGFTSAANAASLERVDSLILGSVYRLATKLTDRASAVVGKTPPTRTMASYSVSSNKSAASGSSAMSTESQLVGTLTELHRLERLIDEISDIVSTTASVHSPSVATSVPTQRALPVVSSVGYRSTTAE